MKAQDYLRAKSLEAAYDALLTDSGTIMGGGLFLRLQKKSFPLLIDLYDLDLDYVVEEADYFSVGAMTTLRTLEKTVALPKAVTSSVIQISGVGTRNIATIGGSVCGRYPFSDINTALIALDAELVFYKSGTISIRDYSKTGLNEKDILIEIKIPKAKFSITKYYKKVYTDFSLVNIAAVNHTIAIGARPKRTVIIENVDYSLTPEIILKDIEFGSDIQASGDYRRALAIALLEDIIIEMEGHSGS